MRRMTAPRRRGGAWLRVCTLVLTFAVMAATYGILAKPRTLAQQTGAAYTVIDLRSGRYAVRPVVAAGSRGESFTSLVEREKPYAAVTGTFYDPDYRPQGDIVAGGKVLSRGHHRQGVGFTASGRIRFLERRINQRINWAGFSAGIASGPRLVRSGRLDVNVRRDGFGAGAATLKAERCAVGATSEGKLILCVVRQPITLDTMGKLMVELGAVDATNMDGGGSCAFYANGSYEVVPPRPMSNILAVYRR